MSDYGLKQMELLDLRAASQHQGDVNSNNNNNKTTKMRAKPFSMFPEEGLLACS